MTAAPHLAAVSLRMVNVPVISQTLSAAKFPQMSALRELDLAYNRIADADLTALGPLPNLRSLNLKGNPLTDAGLVHLTGMTALERLDLRETQVTAAGVQALEAKLPKVEVRWNAP
jgi:Leucine-rich repeat (LRR) protein